MKVEIKTKFAAMLNPQLFNIISQGNNFSKHIDIIGFKLPIEILASQRSPMVPKNNTIGIQHWNDFEDNFISQISCSIRYDIVQKPSHDITTIGLPWVDSSSHQD